MQTAIKEELLTERDAVKKVVSVRCKSYSYSKTTTSIAITKSLSLFDMGVSSAMSISEGMKTARKIQDAFNRGILRDMRG